MLTSISRKNLVKQSLLLKAELTSAAYRQFASARKIETPKPIEKKLFKNALEATKDLDDGASIMAGGFGLCGIPENLILATKLHGPKDLTIISNECGVSDFGLGILLKTKQIHKFIGSFIGMNQVLQNMYLHGELEVELCPQGNLAERIRAGGSGIPAFYSPTAVGTWLEEGKIPMLYDSTG